MMECFQEKMPASRSVPPSNRRAAERLRPRQQLVDSPARQDLTPGVVRRARGAIELKPSKGAAEFCRQARKLRAVYERNPVEMHRHLSRLSVAAAAEGKTVPSDETDTATSRRARAIRWTWTQTAKFGKGGISLLGRLGQGLSMMADDPVARQDMEDDQPRYTLVDPTEPLDDGFPGSIDRTFGALVMRTLRAQGNSSLRYSQRLDLLKEAGRRGIGRFEANLMIASVQHRLKSQSPSPARRQPLRMTGVLAYVLVQTMILWGMWRVTRS
jgi:hypothetical protein